MAGSMVGAGLSNGLLEPPVAPGVAFPGALSPDGQPSFLHTLSLQGAHHDRHNLYHNPAEPDRSTAADQSEQYHVSGRNIHRERRTPNWRRKHGQGDRHLANKDPLIGRIPLSDY